MAIDWKGVFPAVTTKFTSNDTLDLALFTKNIEAAYTKMYERYLSDLPPDHIFIDV